MKAGGKKTLESAPLGRSSGRAEGDPDLVLVLCNAPPDKAEAIGRAVVEKHLAACVNVVPGIVSLYWWQGKLERDAESTLWIKTRRDRVADLTRAIQAVHPYSVPEVIAVAIEPELGNAAYHEWVRIESEARARGGEPSGGAGA